VQRSWRDQVPPTEKEAEEQALLLLSSYIECLQPNNMKKDSMKVLGLHVDDTVFFNSLLTFLGTSMPWFIGGLFSGALEETFNKS
jgi:hypothetical protein